MTDLLQRVRRHLGDPDSPHRQIAVGFLWVSAFVFFGKLAGAAKEMAIAWRYGVSAKVDAYVFVFNLVNWPVAVWLSVLTIVLVPLVVRLRHDAPEELPRFRAELLGLTLLIGVALGLLAWWGLPLLLQAGWLGLSGTALTEALGMAGGLAMLAPLGVVISLFSVWLLAAGRHRNTLFEAIPAATLLVALLLPSAWLPEPLLWGTVAGYAFHMVALAVPLKIRGELAPPAIRQQSTAWPAFWGGIGIMAIGQAMMSITGLIDQFFAAGLGQGALSILSYANRVLALVLGFGAVAITRAALPVFSEARIKESMQLRGLVFAWAKWIFGFGGVVVVIGWTVSSWGVGLLFERGAFTNQDTQVVAALLRLLILQIPFYFSGILLMQNFSASRQFALLLRSYIFALTVKIVIILLYLDNMRLDVLAISTVAFIVAWCAILYAETIMKAESES